MLQRPIPSTGELLPVIGLGSWIQFDVGTAEAERAPLMDVLKEMHSGGGRLLDSSPMYGKSEGVIGDLTQGSGMADEFFYATKVWTTGKAAGIRQMEESYKKMRRQTMDLMQVHNLVDWQAHLDTLKGWKEEGRVRYVGITHYVASAHEQLEQIVKMGIVDFVQFNYSIRVRNAEKSLLPACRDNGVTTIINEPFEKGSLFGLVKGQALPDWAKDYDIGSWAEFFLKFIVSHPDVTCVIPGTSDVGHLADNMKAGEGRLVDEVGRRRMVAFMEQL
jgi:diketogulonate reductase-like aldo/keto reductase